VASRLRGRKSIVYIAYGAGATSEYTEAAVMA
jgi:hypothetical protein